ncbi:MAG: hypothetical protein AAGD43_09460 [Pseudomonadota bacterium]
MSNRKESLGTYVELVEAYFDDQVKGKANPYTSMNGNMYSFLDNQGRVCLRMAEADREAFSDLFGTGPVQQYGATMKGYVSIPTSFLANTDVLAKAFACSLRYTQTLKKK